MDIWENETDLGFLEQSDAVIFGTPVYFTSLSWELKRWFDNSSRISLKGKLGSAFVTAKSPGGGVDTTIMEMARHMLLKGMLVFSGTELQAARQFQISTAGIGNDMEVRACELLGGQKE